LIIKGFKVAIILKGKPINNELLLHKINELASKKLKNSTNKIHDFNF
jgi:hypothetical protein